MIETWFASKVKFIGKDGGVKGMAETERKGGRICFGGIRCKRLLEEEIVFGG